MPHRTADSHIEMSSTTEDTSIAYLELTNSDKLAIVDDLYYEDLLALGPWRLHSMGYAEMAIDTAWGRCFLHNVVMQMFGHDLTGITVDHADRERLDCRRRNLRVATRRQQNLKQGRRRDNTSGFKGVYWHKQKSKWGTYVRVNGKPKHIGYFADPISAARARDAAILAGPDADFAYLNFPLDKSA